MALVLTIGGNDHTAELVHESLIVNQTNDGLNSTCHFDLVDTGVLREDAWTVEHTHVEDGDVITGHVAFSEPKVVVSVVDGATVYFAGILSRINIKPLGVVELRGVLAAETQILRCSCHDYSALLETAIIDSLEEYVNTTDEDIIDDIFTKYVNCDPPAAGIDFATFVDGDVFTFRSISFENINVRQAMDLIIARTGYVWYMDYSKKLHYSEAEANAPGWHLSDVPDVGDPSYAYLDPIQREEDATNLVNRIFVVSSVGGDWFTDEASVAKYGPYQAIVRDARLSIAASIEARADALLAKFANPEVIYTVRTYKDGLRAGMHLRLVCAYYDVDEELLINKLKVTFPDDGAPIYGLTLGGLESSAGASARRATLDEIYTPPPVSPDQLPLASRGWGHDLTFSATDDDTVEWEGPGAGNGTLTTAGGQTFAIAPGNSDDPGAMTEKTIVYLDLVEDPTSPHDLQMTTDETAALGAMKIMIAVCWPSGEPTVDAGFQVFGATAELATYLNATNVIADCITANEIYGNTLSVIAADMGLLTAGEIRMIGAAGSMTLDPTGIKLFDGNDPAADNIKLWLNTANGMFTFQSAIAGNPRIEITNTEIAGYDGADVLQFEIDAATGKALAGAGVVILDEDGIQIEIGGDLKNRISFMHSGTERGYIWPAAYALGTNLDIQGGPPSLAAHLSTMNVRVRSQAGTLTGLKLASKKTGVDGYVRIFVENTQRIKVNPAFTQVDSYLRVLNGLYVGGVAASADDNDIWCLGEVSTDGGTTKWNLGSYIAGVQVDTGYVVVVIEGTPYKLLAKLG